ncbi:MAG: hypothetical protein IJ689_06640 [Alphaproteobacteria bacterium]|nr:hypothetical protein [Alphaproteobacteria bacterium]
MKNYILLLGVAGVALGSYAAYAGNSATMTVTATIAHDVSLAVTQALDLGTITINPAGTENSFIFYDESGAIIDSDGDIITAADTPTPGYFTANIPNPLACNDARPACGGLSLDSGDPVDPNVISNIFGGNSDTNFCGFYIKYTGSSNRFKVFPNDCHIYNASDITAGSKSKTINISYNPE